MDGWMDGWKDERTEVEKLIGHRGVEPIDGYDCLESRNEGNEATHKNRS